MKSIVAQIILLSLAACTIESAPPDATTSKTLGTASITNANGEDVGQARIILRGKTVFVSLTVSNLPAGSNAVHLHTFGRCDGPEFTSAGGHLNPFQREHGSMNANGTHLGDLPNIVIGRDGTAEQSFELHGDAEALPELLFDADGTSIVIHAKPDDYISNPSGAAGPRVACGVFLEDS